MKSYVVTFYNGLGNLAHRRIEAKSAKAARILVENQGYSVVKATVIPTRKGR